MKILAPIQSYNDGSSFYRLITPIKYLNSSSIHIQLHCFLLNKFQGPKVDFKNRYANFAFGVFYDQLKQIERLRLLYSQNHYDFVWINRSLLNFKNRIDSSIKNVIYDFDDSVWLSDSKHCFESYCKRAKIIFAGNDFLAEKARQYNSNVAVIPTSVDTEVFRNENQLSKPIFRIGWIGSSAGFGYLLQIENELASFFKKCPDAKLVVVSENYPHTLNKIKANIEYIKWSRYIDVLSINQFSVGIFPLLDNEWDKGKCSLKLLQYMACGIPVIASAVGMNFSIFSYEKEYGKFGTMVHNQSDWAETLYVYYCESQNTLEEIGKKGRNLVLDVYSTKVVSNQIQQHLEKL